MSSVQATEQPLQRTPGPVRRGRRRARAAMESVVSTRRTNRDVRDIICAPVSSVPVETVETIELLDGSMNVNEADISCIDITEDDDVVCIGSESSDVLPIRSINRRVQQRFTPQISQLSNAPQFPQLIGSGVTVNGRGPIIEPPPEPIRPVETIIGKVIKCLVCLEDVTAIETSGKKLISTNCGHIFCEPCIKQTMKVAKSCPTCRKKLTAKSYHAIFL